jgi:hypothetical protein
MVPAQAEEIARRIDLRPSNRYDGRGLKHATKMTTIVFEMEAGSSM